MKCYDILYSKDAPHKKRKIYHDGLMKVEESAVGSSKVILLNDEDKVLFQQKVQDTTKFVSDSEVKIGVYQVQIEKENVSPDSSCVSASSIPPLASVKARKIKQLSAAPVPRKQNPFNPQKSLKFNKSSTEFIAQGHSSSSSSSTTQIDPQLLRVMHPHQIEAVEFLLNRLHNPLPLFLSTTTTVSSRVTQSDSELRPLVDHELDYILAAKEDNDNDSDDSDFDDEGNFSSKTKHCSKSAKKNATHNIALLGSPVENCRGAILADEMGLGKSLVSIAVLWNFVKHGRAKGIIVCPSSLVDNWYNEIKKWLGVRLNAIRVRAGSQARLDINTFIVGHRTMSPVLIISYELFRKYINEINKVPKLEIVVCDEGHRLKNASGTQTTRSLMACVATRRIVLTGSPIQNNLDELYAILQFVAPGNELGSLPQFKYYLASHQSSHPSSNKRSSSPNANESVVEKVLGSLILRRTQDEILRKILPPRTEVFLMMKLTDQQERQYGAETSRLLNSLGSTNNEKCIFRKSNNESDIILPGLQRLRQICNVATIDENELSCSTELTFQYDANSLSTTKKTCSGCKTSAMSQSSSKLQLLDTMLEALHSERSNTCSYKEKIVIVSSFTAMLDRVFQLLNNRGWGKFALRLDGSVPSEVRLGLVERFNRTSDPCWVFLLAAKAGGVGLNLIGANRLVMMDCDWNPSVDLQAMARVWRQGQRLPVTVFRFLSAGKIEQSIIERQMKKGKLLSVLDCLNPIEGKSSDEAKEKGSEELVESEGECGKAVSLDDATALQNEDIGATSLEQLITPKQEISNLTDVALENCQDSLLRELYAMSSQGHFLGMKMAV